MTRFCSQCAAHLRPDSTIDHAVNATHVNRGFALAFGVAQQRSQMPKLIIPPPCCRSAPAAADPPSHTAHSGEVQPDRAAGAGAGAWGWLLHPSLLAGGALVGAGADSRRALARGSCSRPPVPALSPNSLAPPMSPTITARPRRSDVCHVACGWPGASSLARRNSPTSWCSSRPMRSRTSRRAGR